MTTKKTKSGVSRRTFISAVGAAGAAGAAATLSGLSAPAVFAQGRRKIRFLNTETSIDSLRALKVAAAEYERVSGTEVVIDSVPLGDAFTKVTTSLRSGSPYDIATLGFVGHVLILAEGGHLVEVNDLTDPYDWGPNILFPINGKNYWYPFDYNLSWIYYRKDLYDDIGLSVPTTWDEFLSNAQKLNTDKRSGSMYPIGSNGATNWMSTAFMWADGVDIFDDNWNIVFDQGDNAKSVVKYLDFFAELYKTMPIGASQASYGEMLSNFASDQIAHSAYAGRLIEAIERNSPDLADKFGIMPYMDSSGKGKAVNHGYDGWVVLNTEASEESMKFMRWFTESQFINFLHTAPLHFQPPRLDIYDDQRWRAHPLIEKYADIIETTQSFLTDPNVRVTSIDTQGPVPDLRPGKVFESFAIPEMLQKKCLQGLSSEDCLQQAGEAMRKAIA
ncbi:ABC transporter substrate-binding protein [Hoeflea sp. TYP-13]|uniref:ABC transporter substrate-binding protein n=1 Tax=Hoeflea sp. TYP-13 TaxID=3230023 RepID=UPI0034C6DECD